ncbi:PD-(D/E)XK nuclease family protein [Ramlibacter sp.]|uniref:PD-(D/E)XK nuclease family protein n=1 Tax=Ramlibacter sp. TaxID=1917967 RepID=UPI0035AE5025
MLDAGPAHPAEALWDHAIGRLRERVRERGVHPSRVVVLVPYAQLMAAGRAAWGRHEPGGFAPRFQTTRNWAAAAAFEPALLDLAFDRARDLLTAQALLSRAGLGERANVLAARLLDATLQLAPLAAAVAPAARGAWAARARQAAALGMEADAVQLEAAVARVAVEWAAASGYATDVLLQPQALDGVDLLVVLQGLHDPPLHDALLATAGERGERLPLAEDAPAHGRIGLHACAEAADEAQRAAACVLRHLTAGRLPVALAATDRALTRRIAALLRQAGVTLDDEQGWKLSTTRSAARLAALLAASEREAPTDAVLDALKNLPVVPQGVTIAIERRARRAGLRDWQAVRPSDLGEPDGSLATWHARIETWRGALQQAMPLAGWLDALRGVLDETGLATELARDAAGVQMLEALRLRGPDDLRDLPQADRRLRPAAFRAWVDEVLEAASFQPPAPPGAQVVVLPLAQMLGRAFAAAVLPGCDEIRLPAQPQPPGDWTPAQRLALGLPTRERLAQAQQAAWQQALATPEVDVLWRATDAQGEAVLASPLVRLLAGDGVASAADPRPPRAVTPAPVAPPCADGSALMPATLSASAYEDLRRCPYRFHALRQLGLREEDELETEADKRDFGDWLHAVLRHFHEHLRDQGEPAAGRAALLDELAKAEVARLRLAGGDFLPFEAAWPAVRDGYLAWLGRHEASGHAFEAGEQAREEPAGLVRLKGRIDRVDRAPGGRLLIDYKTEALQATRDRLRDPLEDTQLAFYALLFPGEAVQAAYLNLGERGETVLVPHRELEAAREALAVGIADDLARVAAGTPLRAIGAGRTCELCAARGLCRKDFWA